MKDYKVFASMLDKANESFTITYESSYYVVKLEDFNKVFLFSRVSGEYLGSVELNSEEESVLLYQTPSGSDLPN